MTEIELGKTILPPTATIEDVELEVASWKGHTNPNIISSHTFSINKGIEAHRIAVCYEIVDKNTGEFHHHSVEIFCVQRYKNKGWTLKDKYRIKDIEEINALKECLKIVSEEYLGRETQTRILVKEPEYKALKEFAKRSNSTIVKKLLEEKEGLEEIFQQGGEDFFKRFIQWFRNNQHIEGVTQFFQDMLSVFGEMKNDDRARILELFRKQNLTREDLDILSGRKEGLRIFEEQLGEESTWTEPNWQEFFENNDWILGYGLDYRFLKILQREARVSNIELDGKNAVIVDFLLGCSNFTVLVELKRPDTVLFTESKNRSGSWNLSSHLTKAVSQILTQKAEWLLKSEGKNYNKQGELINQETHDPKTILIIGNTKEFQGEDFISSIKRKTFELFRRNLRNIEIFTFDEMLDRARFIVRERNNFLEPETSSKIDFSIPDEFSFPTPDEDDTPF